MITQGALDKKLEGECVLPAGHAGVPAEICTPHTDKCRCCATHTPSTGLSCRRWPWWCWSQRRLCCASGGAESQRQFPQTPAAPKRSRGAEPPCWPWFTPLGQTLKLQSTKFTVWNHCCGAERAIDRTWMQHISLINGSIDKGEGKSTHKSNKSPHTKEALKTDTDEAGFLLLYLHGPQQYSKFHRAYVWAIPQVSAGRKSCGNFSGISLWWVAGDCICN